MQWTAWKNIIKSIKIIEILAWYPLKFPLPHSCRSMNHRAEWRNRCRAGRWKAGSRRSPGRRSKQVNQIQHGLWLQILGNWDLILTTFCTRGCFLSWFLVLLMRRRTCLNMIQLLTLFTCTLEKYENMVNMNYSFYYWFTYLERPFLNILNILVTFDDPCFQF